MQSRQFVRRRLPPAGRNRQIFGPRRPQRSGPVLVAGTIAVCLALVFTIGFKVGRNYNVDSVAEVNQLASTVPATSAVAQTRQ